MGVLRNASSFFGISFPFCSNRGEAGKKAANSTCPYSYGDVRQQPQKKKKSLSRPPPILMSKRTAQSSAHRYNIFLVFYGGGGLLAQSQTFSVPLLPSHPPFCRAEVGGEGGGWEHRGCSADNSWKGKQLEGDREDICLLLQPLLLPARGFCPPRRAPVEKDGGGGMLPHARMQQAGIK